MDKIFSLSCLRCEYKWIPRMAHPKKCPACNSPYWNKPRKNKISVISAKKEARPYVSKFFYSVTPAA